MEVPCNMFFRTYGSAVKYSSAKTASDGKLVHPWHPPGSGKPPAQGRAGAQHLTRRHLRHGIPARQFPLSPTCCRKSCRPWGGPAQEHLRGGHVVANGRGQPRQGSDVPHEPACGRQGGTRRDGAAGQCIRLPTLADIALGAPLMHRASPSAWHCGPAIQMSPRAECRAGCRTSFPAKVPSRRVRQAMARTGGSRLLRSAGGTASIPAPGSSGARGQGNPWRSGPTSPLHGDPSGPHSALSRGHHGRPSGLPDPFGRPCGPWGDSACPNPRAGLCRRGPSFHSA